MQINLFTKKLKQITEKTCRFFKNETRTLLRLVPIVSWYLLGGVLAAQELRPQDEAYLEKLIRETRLSRECKALLDEQTYSQKRLEKANTLLQKNRNLLQSKANNRRQGPLTELKLTQGKLEQIKQDIERHLDLTQERIIRRGCPGIALAEEPLLEGDALTAKIPEIRAEERKQELERKYEEKVLDHITSTTLLEKGDLGDFHSYFSYQFYQSNYTDNYEVQETVIQTAQTPRYSLEVGTSYLNMSLWQFGGYVRFTEPAPMYYEEANKEFRTTPDFSWAFLIHRRALYDNLSLFAGYEHEEMSYLSFDKNIDLLNTDPVSELQVKKTAMNWATIGARQDFYSFSKKAFVKLSFSQALNGKSSLSDGTSTGPMRGRKWQVSYQQYLFDSFWGNVFYEGANLTDSYPLQKRVVGFYLGYQI